LADEGKFGPAKLAASDPWGNTYQYLNIEDGDTKGKGNLPKDKNLLPINSDFDLYSNVPDDQSVAPLTAKASRDDIVRVNDGG
jgi:general secretion pathway protein G